MMFDIVMFDIVMVNIVTFDIVMIQRSRIVVLFPFDSRVFVAWCLLLGRLGHWHIRLQTHETGKSRNSCSASGGGVGA